MQYGGVREGIVSELKYLLYAMFVYLEIDMNAFKVLIVFMAVDTVSGILKTIKLDYKEFSFKRLMWGFVSKIGILIIPLVVALLFKGVGGHSDMLIGVTIIIKILIVSEFISTISNIYTVKTGIIVKDVDVFTMIFKGLRRGAFKLLDKYTKLDLGQGKEKEDEQR